MLLNMLAGTSYCGQSCHNLEARIRAALPEVLPGYLDSHARMTQLMTDQQTRLSSKLEEEGTQMCTKLKRMAEEILDGVTKRSDYYSVNDRFFHEVRTEALAIHNENARKIESMLYSAKWQGFACGMLGGAMTFGACMGVLLFKQH